MFKKFLLYASYLIAGTLLFAGFYNSWFMLLGIASAVGSFYLYKKLSA